MVIAVVLAIAILLVVIFLSVITDIIGVAVTVRLKAAGKVIGQKHSTEIVHIV